VSVEIIWEHAVHPLPDAEVERAVTAALKHGGRSGVDLGVIFVDDEFLMEMHAAHMDDAGATDVITFDLGEDGFGPAGEVYVSVERAFEVASERSSSVERELTLYVVHGVLHLCGFDDHEDDDRARMRAAERVVLGELGHSGEDGPLPFDHD